MRVNKEHIESLIGDLAGDDGIEVLRLLKGKQNVSEFKLAEKLGLTVNQVRNLLYKMHEHNLVSHTRKKDKKKGWYIYYWTFKPKQAKSLLLNVKREKLNRLRSRLQSEKEESFFVCDNGCMRINSQNALDINYTCSDCGNLLIQQKNNSNVAYIEGEINLLERDLNLKKAE